MLELVYDRDMERQSAFADTRTARDLPGADADIATLRKFIAERFPGALGHKSGLIATGVTAIDGPLGGGLPLCTISEVLCPAPSVGGQALLIGLLQSLKEQRRFAALVDGTDSFDPGTITSGLLKDLLWVRCHNVKTALHATDVLMRDENFPLVILDLRWNDLHQFRGIRTTVWYRLQRLSARCGLVILSSRPLVPSARIRITLSRPLSLDALEMPLGGIFSRIEGSIQKGCHYRSAQAVG